MKVSLSTIVLAALAGSALAAPSGAGAQRQATVEASQAGAGAAVNLAQADAQELLRTAIKLNHELTENQHLKRDVERKKKPKEDLLEKISQAGEKKLQKLFGNGKLETPQGVIARKQRRSISQRDQQAPPPEGEKDGLLSGLLRGLLGGGGKKGAAKPSSTAPAASKSTGGAGDSKPKRDLKYPREFTGAGYVADGASKDSKSGY